VPKQVSVPAAVLICAVGMAADRLASQERVWLPRALAPAYGAAEHWAATQRPASEETELPWAAQVVQESGLSRVRLPRVPFAQAHPQVPGPNALQTSVMEQLPPVAGEKGPGILVVTDGTGAGKTITAWEAARILNASCGTLGVAYLLPTTATADAGYDTLEAYVRAHRPERAPVTLVHNHSWLNAAYSDPMLAVTAPDPWLAGWDRALLAQFTVATIDQALMAVLPVRYSALRTLALSGRTVIIDEVHAFTSYTQRLLGRLLHWLGALRTPVVLLSATLPREIADELVRAYLAGAGHRLCALPQRSFAPPYPGWIFVDAADAGRTVMAEVARAGHAGRQRRTAALHMSAVSYRPLGEAGRTVAAGERLARIGREIAPTAAEGGCAAVVCATVADAQDTYRYLKRTLAWPGGSDDLVLLHARFPGYHREAVTRRVRAALGPRGPRPERLIVVTTSLLDVSLDIDVDVMISDLASVARLLQRLGRLWRFEQAWLRHRPATVRSRPVWARSLGPRLTVLHPVDADRHTLLPEPWLTGETAFVLHATAALLGGEGTCELTLPDDTGRLVEQIHSTAIDPAGLPPALAPLWAAHQAQQRAEEHLAATQLIPPHTRASSLADLHRQHLAAAQAATRVGDRPRRVLACYRHADGRVTLEPDGTRPLPHGPNLRPADIRAVLERTLPVPEAWVAARGPEHRGPEAWQQHPLLAGVVLLEHDPYRPHPVRIGHHMLRLDGELGLLHHED
jgi:CRISPR-associated endonuclease/helicase Cas3